MKSRLPEDYDNLSFEERIALLYPGINTLDDDDGSE